MLKSTIFETVFKVGTKFCDNALPTHQIASTLVKEAHTMSITFDALLLPIPETRTHVVESSLTKLPHIVERVSKCGALKMHIPSSVPDQISLTVEPVRRHGMEAPPSVLVGKNVILQGEVVRNDGASALISHGGMMMCIKRSDVSEVGHSSQLVRTTISF